MKAVNGMYRDASPEDIPEGKYYGSLNGILTEKRGAVENEPGTSQFGTNITGDVVGVRPLENGDTVLFLNGSPDRIVLVEEDGTITQVCDNNDFSENLEFDSNQKIYSEFYVNSNSQRVVAFIQGNKEPRIINIEQTIADIAAGSTPIDIKTLSLFPKANFAHMDLELLPGGGSLSSGSYSIIYRYKQNDGGRSDWSVPSRAVPISNKNSPFEGSEGGNISGYGIRINLGDISTDSVDESYDQIEWGYIKSENGQLEARKFGTTTITQGYTSITLTSEANTEDLLLEEILTVAPLYDYAQAITQLDNSLFLGNLSNNGDPLENFQRDVVNNITLDFTVTEVDPSTVTREDMSDRTTFMPGEVYAFYLQVQINGKWSRCFHVPGAPLASNGNDNVNYPSPSGITGGTVSAGTYKRFQIEDTASLIGTNPTGDLGGYENMDEDYPNDDQFDSTHVGGLDLRGQAVRHHKFPSIGLIQNRRGASSIGKIFILGVNIEDLDLNPAGGDDYRDLITGFRLLHAERNFQNATTLGQSSVFIGGIREGGPTTDKYPCAGGFDIVAASGSAALSGIDKDTSLDHIRWHGFDLLRSKPSVNINNLRLDVFYDDISRIRLNTNSATNGDVRAERVNAEDASTITNQGPITIGGSTIPTADMIAVDVKEYVPNGVVRTLSLGGSDTVYNNIAGEEHLLLEAETALPAIGQIGGDANSIGDATPGDFHLYLATALNIQRNVYSTYDNQSLRPVTEWFTRDGLDTYSTNPTNLDTYEYGGDAFVGPYGILCTAPISTDIANFPNGIRNAGGNILGEGCRAIFTFPTVYNNLNHNMRYSEDDQGFYWPKFDPTAAPETEWVNNPMSLFDLNNNLDLLYNDDHTLKIPEQVTTVTIESPSLIIDTNFPNVIIRSEEQQRQELNVNWQNFPALDTYTIEREKGAITNLQGAGNSRLFIHTSNSLYITKNKTVLASTADDVTLGSGDIFAIPPAEVVPSGTGGFTGTNNPLACIMTKLGYVFPNLEEGKVFLHDGSALKEISNTGMRTFFRTYFDLENVTNVITGYDEEYNRILITYEGNQRKSGLPVNFTVSYSPDISSWVSFHSYLPNYYYSHPNLRLFGITTGSGTTKIWLHNDLRNGTYGEYYDYVGTYPFEFTAVYNRDPYENKYFNGLEWVTEVRTNPLKSGGLDTETTVSDETFDVIEISTVRKATGPITLVPRLNSKSIYSSNVRNVENTWKFNKLRNELDSASEVDRDSDTIETEISIQIPGSNNIPWYKKARFVDKYILVTYTYQNNNDNKISLLDHDVEVRRSFR